jgi:ubiquinone/menaquinone biosynthesis C-methylase UbiE
MDKQRIADFADTVYRDMAGTMAIGMAYLGHRTGLFAAMAGAGPVSAPDLARETGLQPRYVLEWLNGMASAGWIDHDSATDTFTLPDEHAYLTASEGSDHFVGGLFLAAPPLLSLAPEVARAFRDGGGVAFDAFGPDWTEALDQMNEGAYRHRLTGYWLGHLPEITERLAEGGSALDVGCGLGKVARILAEAWPLARVSGVDPDAASIVTARDAACGIPNVDYIHGTVADIPTDAKYDLALLFDCLHDLSDPVATLADIRARLAPGGALLVMEPRAADTLEGNTNPLGTIYYGFSLFHCMTQSLARGGPGHGTCMGPARTRDLLREGGFSRVSELPIKSQTNMFCVARA